MSFRRHSLLAAIGVMLAACMRADPAPPPPALPQLPAEGARTQQPEAFPTPRLANLARERREVAIRSGDVQLAGELDLPGGVERAPLVVVIHHSGPVTRDAYGYLAELLVGDGMAVFRFDKRGTGRSGGVYGCCESDDALAAYAAAVSQPGVDSERVFIVAQSVGTRFLAERFSEFQAVRPPRAVALLSNLLGPDTVTAVAAPALIVVAASEPDLQTIGSAAAEAHAAAVTGGTDLYIAEGAEHSLFDVRAGPIDWSDPAWVERYHRGAMARLRQWLAAHAAPTSRSGPLPYRQGFNYAFTFRA